MTERIFKIIFVLYLAAGFSTVQAQQGRAEATMDMASILIGDQVRLRFSYTCPASAQVQWPVFADTLTRNVEILEQGKTDTSFSSDKKELILTQELVITSFDSGYYQIPPVRFSHTLRGDTSGFFAETLPLTLIVHTVAVDTTQSFKDIKDILGAPLTLMEILPWVIGSLFLAALITIGVMFLMRRKKKQPFFGRAKPQIPPHVKALEALEALRAKHLWQQGRIKEYHSVLTDIVRIYIEGRFGVDALEMVTSEVLDAMRASGQPDEQNLEGLRRILQTADMVKFAKYNPLPDEHDGSFRSAVRFVNETAPKEEEPAEGKPENSDGKQDSENNSQGS